MIPFFKRRSKKSPACAEPVFYSAAPAEPVSFAAQPPALCEDVTQTLFVPDSGAAECGHTEQQLATALAEAASCMAIGTREYQQDAVRISGSDDKMVCVLCDGMGGLSGGEAASNLAAEGMLELMTASGGPYPMALSRAAVRLNEQVKALRDAQGRRIEAGTTLTTVIVDGAGLFWCSIGDSHIYLYRGGALHQLNVDHNLGTQLDENVREGRLSEEEAQRHPQRAALTSYLGISELTLIGGNMSPIPLQKGDIVLQCSDGLYHCLSEQEICSSLLLADSLAAAARTLVDSAIVQPGAHDNTSALLLRYAGPAPVE